MYASLTYSPPCNSGHLTNDQQWTEASAAHLTQERTQHAVAQAAWYREKNTLEADLARATGKVKPTEPGTAYAPNLQSSTANPPVQLPPSVRAAITPVAPAKQIYLQFWFDWLTPTPSSNEPTTEIRAATSSTPIPYGLTSSWPGVDFTSTCAGHGNYDSRMDPAMTGPTLPTTVSHRVVFGYAFPSPPKVVVWLTGFSAAPGAAVSVQVTAINITETKFVLQINSGDGARLGSIGVGWAVWPATGVWPKPVTGVWPQPAVEVGSVSTRTPGKARVSSLATTGVLQAKKMLLVAVCAVDLVLAGGLWMEVAVGPNIGGEGSFLGHRGYSRVPHPYDPYEDEGMPPPPARYPGNATTWSMKAGPSTAIVYSARVAHVSQ